MVNLSHGDEVIIVDDGSTDKTPEVLADIGRDYPAVKVLKHAANKGGAVARNTAVENAAHSILFCLDSEFADDTGLNLHGQEANLQRAEQSLQVFCVASEALINWRKTVAF